MNLEDRFKYHPPLTKERVEKHETINHAALNFAKACQDCIKDEERFNAIINQIQIARMLANQAVTFEE